MRVLPVVLLLLAAAAPPIRQPLDEAPLTSEELAGLYQVLSSKQVDAQWIAVHRFDGFGAKGVSATAFPTPTRTSPRMCRGTSLAFGYIHDWSFLGETTYVAPIAKNAECGEEEISRSRITLAGSVTDEDILAIVDTIRQGRALPEDPPKITTLPDGSVSASSTCCRVLIVDKKNRIARIEVASDGSVKVTTSRRPGAGQELQLRKLKGMWYIAEAVEWVA